MGIFWKDVRFPCQLRVGMGSGFKRGTVGTVRKQLLGFLPIYQATFYARKNKRAGIRLWSVVVMRWEIKKLKTDYSPR